MSLRPFRSLLLSFLAGTGALAQSYQTAFSDVKFDRAKGPATFTAGLEVEAATGAASMNLPFGPGIGERGLKFRPILSMRMGPQMAVTSSDVNVIANYAFGDPLWGLQSVDSLFQRGFGAASFSPGTLDLGALVSTTNRKTTTYSLPGGGGGRVLGKLPAATTPSAVQALLSKFGFSATDTVGFLPGSTSRATKAPFLQMGSDGSLVVGLRLAGPAAGLTDEVSDDIQQNPASVLYQWDFPRRIAVIQGEVAYEFHYVHHTYMTRTLPFMAVTEKPQLSGGHYVITKIRNKFGESIEFVYDTNGVGYTASWRTSPAAAATARIRVEVLGQVPVAPGQPRLMLSSQQVTSATQIRVSYQGVSQPVSSYLLEVADPNLGTGLVLREGGGPAGVGANSAHGVIDWDWVLFDTPIQSIQPLRVTQERTNEEIRFAYGVGPECSWDNGSLMKAWPTVLASITFPTRTVSLTWEPYRFRMNYSPEGWGGFVPSTLPGRPAYGYGVVRIDDSDGTQLRTTRHQRVVPVSNWNNLPLQLVPPDRWMDTRFYDVITHADGSVSLHRFVEPPPGNALSGAGGMQNLAFIKALEREVR